MNWHGAFAKIIFPGAYLGQFLHSYLVIAISLIVKFIFVRQLTKFSWLKCLLADFTINLVSLLLGVFLIPLAGLAWHFCLGLLIQNYIHLDDYNLGLHIWPFIAWSFAGVSVIFINAWLESLTLKIIFDQGNFAESKKFFRWLCVANIPVLIVAFGQSMAYMVWETTKDRHLLFRFIGQYFDVVTCFVIGTAALLYYSDQTKKDIESGKRTEIEAKRRFRKIKLCSYVLFFLGALTIIDFFR